MGQIILVGTGNAFNSGNKANQAFWIKTQEFNILVDCGPTTLYRLNNLNLSINDLDAILFTHFHGDHILGLPGLDLTLTLDYKRTRPIIYAGPILLKKQIDKIFEISYSDFYPNYRFQRQIIEFIPNQSYKILDKINVSVQEVMHSKNSIGYKLEIEGKIISITGDTGWCTDLIKLSENSDVFLCECNYFNKNKNEKHLSYQMLYENREFLKSKKIVLVHPSKEMLSNKEKLDFELAEDGMVIDF